MVALRSNVGDEGENGFMIPSPHHRLHCPIHPPIRHLDLRHCEARYPVPPTVKSAPGRVVVMQHPRGVDFREAADK